MNPNKTWEEYIFCNTVIKLVLVVTCIISMAHSVELQWVWILNKIVDGRLHDFHVSSDCKLMKNVKVIQHVHGIEHIKDNLQTKSLEFTSKYIGNFRRKISLTFDNKPPWAHNWHN
jgi:hypothetical protein